MSETIRENITDLSQTGPVWPLIQNLKVSSFNYKQIVNSRATEKRIEELTGEFIPAQPETYIPYPEGIQVMIEPTSLESVYPEGVVTSEDGTKYYRSDLITALLVQAVKEMYEELSNRLRVLESK